MPRALAHRHDKLGGRGQEHICQPRASARNHEQVEAVTGEATDGKSIYMPAKSLGQVEAVTGEATDG
jgi:hypothetical protein